jgi:hypothetical protein
MTATELIAIALCVLIILPLSIVVHELGHLLCGLLRGYRFLSFRLFFLVWTKEDDRIVVRRLKDRVALGQCLMEPSAPDTGDCPVILYNLGGGFANLLLAGACLVVPLATGEAASALWLVSFAAFGGNVGMALINLLPLTFSGIPNDGMNAWMASRSKEAARALVTMLRVNGEVSAGKRYGDYGEADFAISPSADRGNYLIAWLVMAQAERLSDLRRYDESIAILEGLPLDRLPGYYRNVVLADFLFYRTVSRPDEARARKLYGRKELRRFLNLRIPSLSRVLAACEFFLENDHAKGWRLLERAHAETVSLPSRGAAIMEQEWLDDLARRFAETEAKAKAKAELKPRYG